MGKGTLIVCILTDLKNFSDSRSDAHHPWVASGRVTLKNGFDSNMRLIE